MIVVWVLTLVVGLGVAILASGRVVDKASALAGATRIPPFVVGLVVVGVGTDLPEIANSIVASVSGHGDLSVGNSVGSAVSQVTLVLGVLPFAAGALLLAGISVRNVGALIVAALGLVAVLVSDGFLSRVDALLLLTMWIISFTLVWRTTPRVVEAPARGPDTRPLAIVGGVLGYLLLVGGGATLAVVAFVQLAEELGVSEFFLSFFVGAIGTSLPELLVAVNAARRGEIAIAIGDVFGASLADSTLSIAAGPLIAPVAVSAGLAVRASLAGMVVIGLVTVVVTRRSTLDRRTGGILLLLYAATYVVLLL